MPCTAGRQVKRVEERLLARGILLRVDEPALDFLADRGYDPAFGARPRPAGLNTLRGWSHHRVTSCFCSAKPGVPVSLMDSTMMSKHGKGRHAYPAAGARPIKRTIGRELESALAKVLLVVLLLLSHLPGL
jgi:ATP-dependent Clp protease ATP-binding subunit ClpA